MADVVVTDTGALPPKVSSSRRRRGRAVLRRRRRAPRPRRLRRGSARARDPQGDHRQHRRVRKVAAAGDRLSTVLDQNGSAAYTRRGDSRPLSSRGIPAQRPAARALGRGRGRRRTGARAAGAAGPRTPPRQSRRAPRRRGSRRAGRKSAAPATGAAVPAEEAPVSETDRQVARLRFEGLTLLREEAWGPALAEFLLAQALPARRAWPRTTPRSRCASSSATTRALEMFRDLYPRFPRCRPPGARPLGGDRRAAGARGRSTSRTRSPGRPSW